jgi:hypothetical protein
MNTRDRKYAVVTTKFHGGGILFETSSAREAYRWRRRNHDGCFNGRGCEGFATLLDSGVWVPIEIDRIPHIDATSSQLYRYNYTYPYTDGVYCVKIHPHVPILDASHAFSAVELAL